MLDKKTKRKIVKIVQDFLDDNAFENGESNAQSQYTLKILNALGWPSGQMQVNPAQLVKTGNFPDILLLTPAKSTLFVIESKRPKEMDLTKAKFREQLTGYCNAEGVYWGVMTNFHEWRIYSTRQGLYDFNGSDVIRLCDPKTKEILINEKTWRMLGRLSESFLGQNSGRIDSNKVYYPEETEIRKSFFENLRQWRKIISSDLEGKSDLRDINKISLETQKILDRFIFIKACFDWKVVPQNYLSAVLYSKRNKYKELKDKFKMLNDQFDSSLFSHDLCDDVVLADKVVEKVIRELNPIDFSGLNVHIIGEVYEDYLGELLSEKKRQGTYYTPEFIVKDIVENTLGKRLKNVKTLNELRSVSVLDLACGSGSFLIGAFDVLYNKYRGFYGKNLSPEKDFKIKREILLNNLYGVDLDERAVQISQLNLLLKAIKGTSISKIRRKRLLPDLSFNIRCGNALIGGDEKLLDNHSADLDKMARLKARLKIRQQRDGLSETALKDAKEEIFEVEEGIAFDINKNLGKYFKNPEKYRPFNFRLCFYGVFRDGGFDVIVGNPPYVRQESLSDIKIYLQDHYAVFHGMADLCVYFIERGISFIKEIGYWGVIVANKWMRTSYGEPLRKWLRQKQVIEIADLGDLPIFKKATTYPCDIIARGDGPSKSFNVAILKELEPEKFRESIRKALFRVNMSGLNDSGWALIDEEQTKLIEKLKNVGISLGDYVNGKIYRGVLTGLNEAFVIDDKTKRILITEHVSSKELIKPFLEGKDIKQYSISDSSRYLILIPSGWTRANAPKDRNSWDWFSHTYPAIARHLEHYKKKAIARWDKGEYWWELRSCDYYEEFERPKIMLPDISLRGNFVLDTKDNYFCANTAYIISSADKYLLGLLNSKLLNYYYSQLSSSYRGGYLRFIYQYLVQLPIRTINFSDPNDKACHDKIVSLVDQILKLHKEFTNAKTPHEQGLISQIDEVVYELYGINGREISIVEDRKELIESKPRTPKARTRQVRRKTVEAIKARRPVHKK